MSQETVTITVSQFAAMEATIAELTSNIADLKVRIAKRSHHNIDSLRAYDKANPEKAAERNKRYKEANREAINARRRELRRMKKEAAAASETPGIGSCAAAGAPI